MATTSYADWNIRATFQSFILALSWSALSCCARSVQERDDRGVCCTHTIIKSLEYEMTTQLFALGLPAIISVSVAGADQPFTPSTSGRSGRYVHMHIALDFGRPRKHALLVAFSKPVRDAPELDCQYACLLLQPPSASQQRLAKRRGWTKIQTDTLEGHSNPGVTCYWIRVSIKTGPRLPKWSDSSQKEGKADRVILLARPDTANFMGRQPDDSSIAELALPGTHDTCAFYGCASLSSLYSEMRLISRPHLTVSATSYNACKAVVGRYDLATMQALNPY